ETNMMLHLLKQAVNPRLNLKACISDWHNIAIKLRESPRKDCRNWRKLGRYCFVKLALMPHGAQFLWDAWRVLLKEKPAEFRMLDRGAAGLLEIL
ncbi:MAG: hypothetical protein ABFD66_07645, partial [Smithella sp.]